MWTRLASTTISAFVGKWQKAPDSRVTLVDEELAHDGRASTEATRCISENPYASSIIDEEEGAHNLWRARLRMGFQLALQRHRMPVKLHSCEKSPSLRPI